MRNTLHNIIIYKVKITNSDLKSKIKCCKLNTVKSELSGS